MAITRRHPPLLLLLLLAAAATIAGASQSSSSRPVVSPSAAADFVRRSCRATRYPQVCERSLMPQAPAVGRSPRLLAQAALTVGADRARSCSGYLGGGSSSKRGGAVGDCADTVRDAEERLRQSAAEMRRMGRSGSPRFAWRLSNVQTWASAALTDASTCLDSLATYAAPGVDVDALRKRVLAVSQATTNALALVNKLDPHHHL
uniref:Pectinesterase inhibitor domain-containing protein n=1 Tax=Oryza punctata TaxID=4537 RepID=A0A0E0KM30_ORYPU